MQPIHTLVEILQDRGQRRLPLERMYRHVCREDLLVEAYAKIGKNDGATTPGVDGQTVDGMSLGQIRRIAQVLHDGDWAWKPVRRVHIPKKSGGTRPLGIPSWGDRLVQQAIKFLLEPYFEPQFRKYSFGFRPGLGCHHALNEIITWKGTKWFIEGDISRCFDNLDQDLVMKAVRHHDKTPWVLRYIERWLTAPVQRQDGSQQERTKGSPQGAVVSPLLANLVLHHAFDDWMRRNYPSVLFERYADDVIVHAKSKAQAEQLLEAIRARLAECGLELHPEKTKIVYGQDSDRKGQHEHIQFDFLGYTFRPRRAKNYRGKPFVSFLPGVSNKAGKAIRETIREWRLAATRNNQSLEDRARLVNPSVRGWVD